MKKKLLFIALHLIFSGLIFAQINVHDSITEQAFGKRPEITFSFQIQPNDLMQKISGMVSIDKVMDNMVYAVATKKGFTEFLELEIPYIILPSPYDLLPPETWTMSDITDKATYAWDTYPTYQGYLNMMAQFATDYPALCRIDTIGYTVQGRLLLAAVITDNVNTREYEPKFIYSSTMHGDETVGYVLMLRLIDYLLSNYASNNDIAYLVNNIQIHICPNMNPDGTYWGGNNTVTGARRANANGVDLNRNYPVPDGTIGDDGTFTQQSETQAYINYTQNADFVMSANFHGGIELINYPWDFTYANYPDKQWWLMICNEYASSAQNNSPSGYFTAFQSGFDAPGVTNGATWYVVKGSQQDYMLYNAHSKESTIELSNTKNPAASTLPNYWNYNYQAFILYMKQVLNGFKGLVTDSCTNQPVRAKIELVGHDALNSHVYSSLPVGNYHRPVKAGTYTIKASAPGYLDKQYSNVTIADFSTVIRNFELVPVTPVAQFSAVSTTTCDGNIQFQNNSTAPTDVVYTWHFGDGIISNDISPAHTYSSNGTYSVKLVATACSGNDSLVKNSYITVALGIPNSNFSASSTTPSAGSMVTFTDLSACAPTGWLWTFTPSTGVSFVNGTSSSSKNPQVTFSQEGFYTVSLTATNTYGSDSETKSSYINVQSCLYCATSYTNTNDEWISNVTFNTINNNSGSTNYSNFTNISTEVIPGANYNASVTITVNGTYVEYCKIFIDWDRDCAFSSNETYNLGSTSGSGTVSTSIPVPTNVTAGPVRMRVSMRWNTQPTGCDVTTYGEAEDYTLIVLASCTTPGSPVMLSAITTGMSEADLSWSPGTPAGSPAVTYSWEVRTTTGTIAAAGTTQSTSASINGLQSNTTYNFRVKAITDCDDTDSGWSADSDDFTTFPSDPSSINADIMTICEGGSVLLTANNAEGTIYWYSDLCSGTFVGTGNPISVSPATSTTYFAKNYNGNFSESCADIQITVSSTPSTPLAGMLNSVCEGEALHLTASTITGATYLWTGPLGYTSTEQNPLVNLSAKPAMSGQYSVIATVEGCESQPGTVDVHIGEKFESITTETICEGNTYLWRGITYDDSGVYTESFLTIHGCDSLYRLELNVTPVTHQIETTEIFVYDLPYMWHGQTIMTSGTYYASYQNTWGCDSTFELQLTVLPDPLVKTLNVKVFLEGLYSSSTPGMMEQARNSNSPQFGPGIADQISIRLYDVNDLTQPAFSSQAVDLQTDGNATIGDLPFSLHGEYYIVIRHRNSIETWSAQPVIFSGAGPIEYDFTVSANKAYGNNQKSLGSNKFAVYAGDINQDGVIDGSDMSQTDNAVSQFLSGYLQEDINGDGIIDGSDMSIIDNNSTDFIEVVKP
jgi:PKD repeat protein